MNRILYCTLTCLLLFCLPVVVLAQKADPIATSLGLSPDKGILPIWTKPSSEARQKLGEFIRASNKGVMLVGNRKGAGSAFVISRKHCLLATNAHVADIYHQSGGKMFAMLNESTTIYKVSKVYYHPGLVRKRMTKDKKIELVRAMHPAAGVVYTLSPDVAVLQLTDEGPKLPVEFQMATPGEVKEAFAQPIAMLGYPGHDTRWPKPGQTVQATYHPGVISRLTDFQRRSGARFVNRQLIQHTAPNFPGFSGSPLLLPNGHVLGLNHAISVHTNKGLSRDISHGVRIDCLWELLAFHKLDQLVPIPVTRASLALARFKKRVRPSLDRQKYLAKLGSLEPEVLNFSDFGLEGTIKRLSELIQLEPEYPEAYFYRAGSHLHSLRWTDRQFKGLANFFDRSRKDWNLLDITVPQKERLFHLESAFNDLRRAVGFGPDNQLDIHLHMVAILGEWGNELKGKGDSKQKYELAIQLSSRLIPLVRESMTERIMEASPKQKKRPFGYWDPRSQGLERTLLTPLDLHRLFHARGRLSFHVGDYAKSILDLTAALEIVNKGQRNKLAKFWSAEKKFLAHYDERLGDLFAERARAHKANGSTSKAKSDYQLAVQAYAVALKHESRSKFLIEQMSAKLKATKATLAGLE